VISVSKLPDGCRIDISVDETRNGAEATADRGEDGGIPPSRFGGGGDVAKGLTAGIEVEGPKARNADRVKAPPLPCHLILEPVCAQLQRLFGPL